MKEIVNKKGISLDYGMNECCSIAESMIEDINQIAILKSDVIPASNGRYKGSLKKKLLRQIRHARKMAMIG